MSTTESTDGTGVDVRGEFERVLARFRRARATADERYRRRRRLLLVVIGKQALTESGEEEFERRIKELYVAGRISAEELDWAMGQVLSYWRRGEL
jgi:imidazoleglycerol phosphate synthase glutamine amidotransferase subunit HisH